MAKKIYDIKPPKVAQKKAEKTVKTSRTRISRKRVEVKKELPVVLQKSVQSETVLSEEVQKHFPLKEIFIGGGIIVFLLAIYFYNTLGWATVKIYPKTSDLSLQVNITADKSYDNVNILKNIIPARLIVQEKSDTQNFPATGSASNEGQASGKIVIYNKISPASPLTLKAGTHFLSDSGKYFVTLSKIVIPAMKGSTAGSLEVNVKAEESGESYNIGPSKFSVPGLSGTPYYFSIWGESKSAMTGGYTGDIKKVTADDLAFAKDNLTNRLIDEAKNDLRNQISSDEVLIDGALSSSIVSSSADAKDGAVKQSFNETATVSASALVFKKDDLQKFAKLYVHSKLEDGQDLLEKNLTVKYDIGSVNMQSGVEKLALNINTSIYNLIDTNSLINSLTKKSASEIEAEVMQNYGDNISTVDVKFWPFWVNRSPKDKNNIKIELKF